MADEPEVAQQVGESRVLQVAERERAASGREGAALHREETVGLREEVAQLREEVVRVREEANRDLEKVSGELGERNGELLEANQNLVTATLHAQDMARSADEARQAQDRFLAMLAHELRNPLAPVRTVISVLERAPSAVEILPWAREVLSRQVSQMARLLDDLLDASRISRGTVTLKREPVLLANIVEQVVSAHRPLLDQRHHELQLTVPAEAAYVNGDPVRLAQVISNLLGNACKYTGQGGSIELDVRLDGKSIEVRVRDTGCGISPAALPKVFDLFTQEDRSLSRSQGGLGIGLAVVKTMAELHGGSVSAASAGVDQGCEFTLRLPLIDCPDAPIATGGCGKRQRHGPVRRIMLVDDNIDLNGALAALLRLNGHEVTTVNDGVTAIQRIVTERPEVVVCDIGLPGLDGYGVAKHVRSDAGESQPTLIAVTGYGRPEDRERALAAGFDHHLVKPVDAEILSEIIESSSRKVTARNGV